MKPAEHSRETEQSSTGPLFETHTSVASCMLLHRGLSTRFRDEALVHADSLESVGLNSTLSCRTSDGIQDVYCRVAIPIHSHSHYLSLIYISPEKLGTMYFLNPEVKGLNIFCLHLRALPGWILLAHVACDQGSNPTLQP